MECADGGGSSGASGILAGAMPGPWNVPISGTPSRTNGCRLGAATSVFPAIERIGDGRAIAAMFLAVRAMPVLENEMDRAVDTIAHAKEGANRRLCSDHDARVKNGDRRAE